MAEVSRLRDLAEKGGSDVLRFNPASIKIEEGHNPRDYRLTENRQHLDSLKASIKARGVLNPLRVRYDAGQAILVDGECRLRACLELIAEGVGITTVPVMQVAGKNEKDRILDAFTANSGKGFSVWEAGTGFAKLMRYGMSEDEIAEQLGLTVKYVKQALELSDAPEEVKQQLSEQAVSPGLAVIHLKKHGSNAAKTLKVAAKEAKASGKKTATAERTIGVNAWETLGRQIAKRLEANGEIDAVLEKKDESEDVTLPVVFATKLMELYRGKKVKAAKK